MRKTIDTTNLMIGYRRRSSGYNGSISRPINVSTASGELVALAGPNGVGKSTLLRTLAGLQKQVDGRVYLCGKSIGDYTRRELARVVSFVSTEIVHIPFLRVFDMAAMGRYPYTSQTGRLNIEDKFRIMDALEQVGIHHMAWRTVDTLSDGERQRAMIARTLVQDTPVVLFDEPTAYLDLVNKYEMLALLKRLAYRQNKTIVYSTHDLSLAVHTTDKLWLMINACVYEGAPEDYQIQTTIRQAFEGTNIEYNRSTGDILPRATMSNEIEVYTRQDARLIRSALARLGYHCVLNPGKSHGNLPKIKYAAKKNEVQIEYSFGKQQEVFTSFYDFGQFIKTARLTPVQGEVLETATTATANGA
ncbi:MAG: ABC transporter ATP-binding protein [Prevotellaceae bacterium]|jgi:iron complex transport system ATP-binding protein|nr:ABC transporter ATP-binding protein [Prevotellaceae bacterium]